MLDLVISGCNGRMGRVLEELCAAAPDLQIKAGFDILGPSDREFPVFSNPAEFQEEADVVVDFSHPAALTALLAFCIRRNIPAVLATTGYADEQLVEIEAAATAIPIFRSANFSLGINVLKALARQAAVLLGEDFDIEIVERHHNLKKDAPSGTALMLAESANEAFAEAKRYVCGREGMVGARTKGEIGIHAVRGGNIVGEHEVMFAGEDEIVTLSHSARSKRVFAAGALRAAKFMAGKPAGRYDMQDVLGS